MVSGGTRQGTACICARYAYASGPTEFFPPLGIFSSTGRRQIFFFFHSRLYWALRDISWPTVRFHSRSKWEAIGTKALFLRCTLISYYELQWAREILARAASRTANDDRSNLPRRMNLRRERGRGVEKNWPKENCVATRYANIVVYLTSRD